MLQAIAFDFDGVIADSEPLHFRAFRDVLAERSLALTEADYYDRYLGYDDVGVLEAVAADRRLAWTADAILALVERKAELLEELERRVTVLYPGAADAIRRAAADVPIAIVSGARREEIVRVLDRADLTRHFSAIVAAGETAAGKPAADPYRRAMELLGASAGRPMRPSSCVAVEDSRWGLASARAAGLRTVGVTTSYEAEELSSADLVISGLSAFDVETARSLCLR